MEMNWFRNLFKQKTKIKLKIIQYDYVDRCDYHIHLGFNINMFFINRKPKVIILQNNNRFWKRFLK